MSRTSFTREELYELVWSEPMIKLAARYGISGNGLAKACRRANIPVPERGYWAKQQAGQDVPKKSLPQSNAGTPARVTIQPPSKRPPQPEPSPVPASVREATENERKADKPITVPATLSNPHRIVGAWLQDDREKRRESRYDPWRRNLYKAIDATDLDKRRLRILSALFKALEARGYKLIVDQYSRRGVEVVLGDEKVDLQLSERIQQIRRKLTEEEKTKRGYLSTGERWTQEKVPTGELILTFKQPDRYRMMKEWRETPGSPLENRLGEVVAELAGMFEELRLIRVGEAEERARQRKSEEERHRAEMERKRETIRYRRLLSQSENWQTAADIRAFVAAVEDTPLANSERFCAWKTWALGHADRIDPLRSDTLFDLEVSDYDVYSMRDELG